VSETVAAGARVAAPSTPLLWDEVAVLPVPTPPRRSLASIAQRLLPLVPFIAVIAAYLIASHLRLAENPQDKILPSVTQMANAVLRMAFAPDEQSGEYFWWTDTWASLRRIGLGVGIAAAAGLLTGLNIGLLRRCRELFSGFLVFLSMVPPLAVLPILFISLGVDELAKVTLIFLGVFPVIARDIQLVVEKVPREQITKAITLGASRFAIIYRIVMPQVIPRLIDDVRLALGAAWLFLIAAEAIAATEGLGYRIFLMRRYLAMDVILPYLLWIILLGFTFDWLLRLLVRRRYGWYLAVQS
jgi:NitT/TauT family transport system permease protein